MIISITLLSTCILVRGGGRAGARLLGERCEVFHGVGPELRVKCHTSHVTRHTSHVTRQTSNVTRHTSHVTRHTSHVKRHTSHVTRHTSHVTRHTSHVTRHTSHVTHHTSRSPLRSSERLEFRLDNGVELLVSARGEGRGGGGGGAEDNCFCV